MRMRSNGMFTASISSFARLGLDTQWLTTRSGEERRSRRARKVSAPAMREGVMAWSTRGARCLGIASSHGEGVFGSRRGASAPNGTEAVNCSVVGIGSSLCAKPRAAAGLARHAVRTVEIGIERWVVVHFHLAIDLEDLASAPDVIEQLGKRLGKIGVLQAAAGEPLLNFRAVLG